MVAKYLRDKFVRWPRPGFLARLSNIIVVQTLFCFLALALVLFYPASETDLDFELSTIEDRFHALGRRLASAFEGYSDRDEVIASDRYRRIVKDRFSSEPDVQHFELFVLQESGTIEQIYDFTREEDRSEDAATTGLSLMDYESFISRETVNSEIKATSETSMPLVIRERYAVFYYRFEISPGNPAVLAVVADHGLYISERSNLEYALFILFLGSVLISLLTVHFISKRFRSPLKRLMQGFEKTAQGEVYHMLEPDGDSELRNLATSFNTMSESLYNNQRRLKKANERLTQHSLLLLGAQSFLGTLIDSSPSAIITATPGGRLLIYNREASSLFGYANHRVLDMTIDQFFAQPVGDSISAGTVDPDRPGTEVLCRRVDGSVFPAYLVASPIIDGDGDITAHLYIIRDISESESFQEMMIRLDRFCTRGEMAGDIAHEINNYLTVLSGNLELMPLLLKKGDDDKVARKLELMRGTVDKISRFTDGLMDVNHGDVHYQQADVNQLVENVIAFLKPQNRFDGVELTNVLCDELPLVELDVGQIQQVIVNLTYNAADALAGADGEKRIQLATTRVDVGGEEGVKVEVADNGPGVHESKQGVLFQKRFTTKKKGHGIGLVTCKRIIDAHGGVISYRKVTDSLFSFEIPLKHKPTDEETLAEQTGSARQPV